MKRWIILLLIFMVVCIGLYIGYRLAIRPGKNIFASPQPTMVVTGTVKDTTTGQPIAGAKVSDWKYGSGKQFGISDSAGRYQYLTWPEEHIIIAEAPGYKPQQQGVQTSFFHSDTAKIIDFALVRQ